LKEFGNACEFYRARIISLDSLGVEKFDWAEDILYKEPTQKEITLKTSFKLQIVDAVTNNLISEVNFKSEPDAKLGLQNITEDLGLMTKNEFDNKYIGSS
jgi:hypothetical protein